MDLTRLDAARPGGGGAMPLPRAGAGGFVQYLNPDEPVARARLGPSALLARKAAPAVGARTQVSCRGHTAHSEAGLALTEGREREQRHCTKTPHVEHSRPKPEQQASSTSHNKD